MTKDEQEFREYALNVGGKIEDSSIFLSLFTKSYKEDPSCALQLGIAICLGKPICLVVHEGTEVPPALVRLADAIEYVDKDDKATYEMACKRILQKMKERQLI